MTSYTATKKGNNEVCALGKLVGLFDLLESRNCAVKKTLEVYAGFFFPATTLILMTSNNCNALFGATGIITRPVDSFRTACIREWSNKITFRY